MEVKHIEISTKQGKLKGLVKKSFGGEKTYYSFQGIPYAKPPIGNLRFKAPEPYGCWEGIRDATKEGSDSIQRHMLLFYPTGDEDCLYLNVYTTQLGDKANKKAVMVWIHGGGFNSGSGSTELYGPDFLVEEDVVLVTINYRLGALGFLSLENEKVPGNLGLKDQVLALRWVQQYISSFGGDPNNVTIFGESAGAASVNYHMLSPLSRGLFHKAILQSGCSLCETVLQSKPRERALLLARELGCTSQDPDAVLEFLMSVPATEIIGAQQKETLLTDKEKLHRLSLVFVPCVETVGDAPFLPDYPRSMMERGEFSDVPVVMGLTNKEGLLAMELGVINFENVNDNVSLLVPFDIVIPAGSEEERKLGKEILRFYTKQDTLSWDVMQGFIDYISDVHFSLALESTRQYFLKYKKTAVYYYEFSYVCPRAISFSMIPAAFPDKAAEFVGSGACHGDELVLQFKTNIPQAPFVPPSQDDQAFTKKFAMAWTNFAKTGDPNCKELAATWKPDGIQNPHFLGLGKICNIIDGTVYPNRFEFWKNIHKRYPHAY